MDFNLIVLEALANLDKPLVFGSQLSNLNDQLLILRGRAPVLLQLRDSDAILLDFLPELYNDLLAFLLIIRRRNLVGDLLDLLLFDEERDLFDHLDRRHGVNVCGQDVHLVLAAGPDANIR